MSHQLKWLEVAKCLWLGTVPHWGSIVNFQNWLSIKGWFKCDVIKHHFFNWKTSQLYKLGMQLLQLNIINSWMTYYDGGWVKCKVYLCFKHWSMGTIDKVLTKLSKFHEDQLNFKCKITSSMFGWLFDHHLLTQSKEIFFEN